MPRTKLSDIVQKRKELTKKRYEMRKKRLSDKKHELTTAEYTKFCDVIFETYIKLRDGWKCGITGKQYAYGLEFQFYQSCHYFSRKFFATRYVEENCNGQSSACNQAEHWNDASMWRKYDEMMVRKWGDGIIEELRQEKNKIVKKSAIWFWEIANRYYKKCADYKNGTDIVNNRLKKVFGATIADKILLERLMEWMRE